MVRPLTDSTANSAIIPSQSVKPAGQSLKKSPQSKPKSKSKRELPAELAANPLNFLTETFFDAPLSDFNAESLLDSHLMEPSLWRKHSQQLIEQLAKAIEPSGTSSLQSDAQNGTDHKNHPTQRVMHDAYQVLTELEQLHREYKVNYSLLLKP